MRLDLLHLIVCQLLGTSDGLMIDPDVVAPDVDPDVVPMYMI